MLVYIKRDILESHNLPKLGFREYINDALRRCYDIHYIIENDHRKDWKYYINNKDKFLIFQLTYPEYIIKIE